jgi:hypothetical protein
LRMERQRSTKYEKGARQCKELFSTGQETCASKSAMLPGF